MNQKKRNNRLAFLLIVAALCLASCRSNSVTTATVRTDTHDEATVSLTRTVDSVMVRETVVIRERPDTVTVEKTDEMHFESVDCNPSFFHTISRVTHTKHVIDSIVIQNPKVDYDSQREHFRIYFRTLD